MQWKGSLTGKLKMSAIIHRDPPVDKQAVSLFALSYLLSCLAYWLDSGMVAVAAGFCLFCFLIRMIFISKNRSDVE
jgi:hypothetical protein